MTSSFSPQFTRTDLDDFLRQFRTLVECESPSTEPASLAASAGLMLRIGEEITGQQGSVVSEDGCPHVRFDFGTGPRRVILVGHHDTVWPLGTLEDMPFTIRDGVVRGPGTDDMKGGVLIALHSLALIRLWAGRAEALDGVTVLVTGDEELGSITSRRMIESLAAEAEAVLVFESGGSDGSVKIARKGVAIYGVEVHGRAAHAGVEPEKGVNATIEAAHQILAISALGSREEDTTVIPTLTHSGTTTNTVPASAKIAVDSRAVTAAEQRRVDAALRELTPNLPAARVEIHGGINRPPFETDLSLGLYARAQTIAHRLGHAPLRSIAVGGGSDGNFAASMGTPTLDGLGTVGGGSHAVDEHALISWIPSRVELVAALVQELLAERRPDDRIAGDQQQR